ncbi:MAG: Chromate resistance protein ChrB [Hyphomicrobiaceae bacterium]
MQATRASASTQATRVKHFTYAELEENEQEYKKFKSWIEKIRKLDFYKAPRAKEADERLARSEVVPDAYAHNVCGAGGAQAGGRA